MNILKVTTLYLLMASSPLSQINPVNPAKESYFRKVEARRELVRQRGIAKGRARRMRIQARKALLHGRQYLYPSCQTHRRY